MIPLLAAAAIPALFKGISGIVQANRGKRLMAENIRPTYNRPDEVRQSQSIAENSYYNGVMPGQSQLQNQLAAEQASALGSVTNASTSSGDLLDSINKLNYNRNNQLNNIAGQGAQWKLQQQGALQNQLAQSAQFSDKEFDLNKMQPYQDRAAAASALIQSGNQNIYGALDSIGGLAASAAFKGIGGNATMSNQFSQNIPQLSQTQLISGGLKGGIGNVDKMVFNPLTGVVSRKGS